MGQFLPRLRAAGAAEVPLKAATAVVRRRAVEDLTRLKADVL